MKHHNLTLTTLLFFFLVTTRAVIAQVRHGRNKPIVPAVIVFGDSIMDPGNNNHLQTLVKADFPPYGVNFAGHRPTGRFCNGKIPTDFIASKLNIKEYLPAYLGGNISPQDLITGVSFASGGSGYDPLTSKVAGVVSFDRQLELFKEYKERVKAIVGPDRAFTIFNNSLYVICAGSDDVANTYFLTPFRKTTYDISSYANLLVGHASDFFQELINLGANRIGVVGIPPIGCVPSQRTLVGGILRDCNPNENYMAKLFNSRMESSISTFKSRYPNRLLVFADIYGILDDMVQRPSKYGFSISHEGCCGSGKLEVAVLCNGLTSKICSNVSDYIFWDSYHPTERAYNVLVDFLYKKYINLLV